MTIFSLLLSLVFAADLLVIDVEETSTNKEPAQARQEIVSKAIEKISRENIDLILGSSEAKKKESLIKTKVIPQSEKYISYIKQGEMQTASTFRKMKVTLHLSRDGLRDVLKQEGLLHFASENIKMLPFIGFLDKKNSKSYKWWFEDNNYSKTLVFSQATLFQDLLRKEMWGDSFFVMDPMKGETQRFIPSNIKSIAYSVADLQAIGANLGSQLVIDGRVHYGPSPKNSLAVQFEMELEAVLVASGRKVATIKKVFEAPVGNYDDIVKKHGEEFYKQGISEFKSEVLSSWQKGVFDTDRVKIVVLAELSYSDLNTFKQQLTQKSLKLKNLTDRSFAPGEITLEADVSQGANALVNELKTFTWRGKPAKVWKSGAYEVSIDI
jgi:hypothetical protein